MVTMIPAAPGKGTNKSEKAVFMAFEGILERPDWVVFHSLDLGHNSAGIEGEADFIVLAPGHGIVLVETKSPKSVQYSDGQWYLKKSPHPEKTRCVSSTERGEVYGGFSNTTKHMAMNPWLACYGSPLWADTNWIINPPETCNSSNGSLRGPMM